MPGITVTTLCLIVGAAARRWALVWAWSHNVHLIEFSALSYSIHGKSFFQPGTNAHWTTGDGGGCHGRTETEASDGRDETEADDGRAETVMDTKTIGHYVHKYIIAYKHASFYIPWDASGHELECFHS